MSTSFPGSQDADAGDVAQAMVEAWKSIVSRVAPIVGQRGVAAVYGRSVHLTGQLHPWLVVADPNSMSHPDLAALEAALASRPRSEAAAAADALLQNCHALLASLLGPSLTERLLSAIGSGSAEHADDQGAGSRPTAPSLTPESSPTPTADAANDSLRHIDREAQDLREANAQLVLAALGAQALQAAAETAHRQQTESLAIVAHELRNPLMPIRTAASLLHQVGPQELPRVQAIIERQVAHMARLVDDLLDVSRVNTGKLRVEWQRVDMAATIDAAIDTCRPAMDARRQRLSIQLPVATAMRVDGDAIRLSQVVTNLLDNASKYTPNGGAISLSVEVDDQNLVLSVSDTGIGITREALPKVFEPFVQEPHAIGFNGVGLGLGLTVVGELVKAHGGHVVASSEGEGRGSRFVVTLPLAAGAADAVA